MKKSPTGIRLTPTQLEHLWMNEHDTFNEHSDREISDLVLLCYIEAPRRTRGPVPVEAYASLWIWAGGKIDDWDPGASRMGNSLLSKLRAQGYSEELYMHETFGKPLPL